MISERRRLSTDGSLAQRVLLACFGLVFAAIGAGFVIVPLAAGGLLQRAAGGEQQCTEYGLPDEVQECLPDATGWDTGDGLGFVGLCGVPFVLIGLYLALRALRRAVWLDGTEAKVRGAFGTRAVDLATAEVSVGAAGVRRTQGVGPDRVHRLPTLVARDRGSGRRVTVPLYGAGMAVLPAAELRALADAMTRGRPTTGDDADVHTIARQLRGMADNPLGL